MRETVTMNQKTGRSINDAFASDFAKSVFLTVSAIIVLSFIGTRMFTHIDLNLYDYMVGTIVFIGGFFYRFIAWGERPPTKIFIKKRLKLLFRKSTPKTSVDHLAVYNFIWSCLTIAFYAGIGNGVIFKLVPTFFHKQAGVVNGIVSAMGGLGGFFPPLILTTLFKLTGHYAIGFMALSEIALASLILVIWMYFQDKLGFSSQVINSTVEGIMDTDKKGNIISVNPAFTKLTGYQGEEVLGKTPNLLKSGIQANAFYNDMWTSIEQKGFWQGDIWNRRKDGKNYLEWLTISAIKNEAGEVVPYAGMFSDITDHKAKSVNARRVGDGDFASK
ncbi:PAS domain S-box protein [Bacillus songklensis]|uniref:PAS domain S-box protein n=1 Tax=Bacillus songklensis TaxID=1069116 RepID=A0ABV8B0R6_9BACI